MTQEMINMLIEAKKIASRRTGEVEECMVTINDGSRYAIFEFDDYKLTNITSWEKEYERLLHYYKLSNGAIGGLESCTSSAFALLMYYKLKEMYKEELYNKYIKEL